jgi:hypothetical protein
MTLSSAGVRHFSRFLRSGQPNRWHLGTRLLCGPRSNPLKWPTRRGVAKHSGAHPGVIFGRQTPTPNV